MEYRIEKDSMGEVKVPADKLYGAQSQRSIDNFRIGWEKMPDEVISAFAILKKASALANLKLGVLDEARAMAIAKAADEALEGKLSGNFGPGGLADGKRDAVEHERERGSCEPSEPDPRTTRRTKVHPNNHVNKCQSSNDTFRQPCTSRGSRTGGPAPAGPGETEGDPGREVRAHHGPGEDRPGRHCRTRHR
jgi:Fumarase